MDKRSLPKSEVFFWALSLALFALAVALRWYNLDLMTFRFDQAAVAFRAMETFRGGFPLTGIENSLGFQNAGGYVWTVLPAFLLSPDPRLATAWHGLLGALIIFPLAMLGRRYRSDALAWLPAVTAAVVPVSVFAGRNLWAQHLLPCLAAWGIYFLDRAMRQDLSPRNRHVSAAWSLGLLAWATSVHFSAGLLLMVAGLFLLVEYKSRLKSLLRAAIPAAIVLLTMVPSVFSFYQSRTNPKPKPDYVLVYEAMLPPPFPWWVRLQESAKFSFWNSSVDAVAGMEALLEQTIPQWLTVATVIDAAVTGLALLGAIAAMILVFGRSKNSEAGKLRLCHILLAWLFVPMLISALLVQRINAGYFLGSLTAVWLLPLCLPKVQPRLKIVGALIPAGMLVAGLMLTVMFFTLIHKNEFVPGNYYVPYGQQKELVNFLRDSDVKPGRLIHLSGGWYQHSYDYIHRYVAATNTNRGGVAGQPYAVMEDKNLRLDEPVRFQFFESQNPEWFNEVGVLIFSGRGPAEILVQQYYETPEK